MWLPSGLENRSHCCRVTEQGKKEPKVKVPVFILGIITLTAGYKLALSAKSIGGAVNILFVSILLVVDRNLLSFYSRKYFYPEVHEKESEVLL